VVAKITKTFDCGVTWRKRCDTSQVTPNPGEEGPLSRKNTSPSCLVASGGQGAASRICLFKASSSR